MKNKGQALQAAIKAQKVSKDHPDFQRGYAAAADAGETGQFPDGESSEFEAGWEQYDKEFSQRYNRELKDIGEPSTPAEDDAVLAVGDDIETLK